MGTGLHPALENAHCNRFALAYWLSEPASLCEPLLLCLQEALSSMLMAGFLRGKVCLSYGQSVYSVKLPCNPYCIPSGFLCMRLKWIDYVPVRASRDGAASLYFHCHTLLGQPSRRDHDTILDGMRKAY